MGRKAWTAVLATAGLGMLGAACGESPTGPEEGIPEVNQNPLQVPGIEVTVEEDDPWTCAESPTCSDFPESGSGGSGSGGDSGSGDGGGGGSSGGIPDIPELPDPPTLGEEPEDLSMEPPDCDSPDTLNEAEKIWCEEAKPPTAEQMQELKNEAEELAGACPELSDDWNRAKDHIRIWEWQGEEFGGASTEDGDWILLARQWYELDTEASLGHELLHLEGWSHPDTKSQNPEKWDAFIAKEKECTGGRSALERG